MNERIKRLATLAGGEFYEGFFGSPNSIKFTEDELQNFAELLIRECAEICLEANDHKNILRHFGVKG